eukprot:CAMPEP_0183723372 /NCGR_PEP_ID=MMETSP0737-20130205/14956_1 /TAXON_ID=385413 /ORGANISM="Thalassiosira miniscula, Strain CCMP1093" /LENGTH=385 /DNA_ID=CAMNT_0025953633 /DNA_START=360 /DNA_END=1517 /DNA_ORIENTATION=-
MIVAMASTGHSLVIGKHQPYIAGRTLSSSRHQRSTVSMYIDYPSPMTSLNIPSVPPSVPITASIASTPSNPLCTAFKLMTPDPELEVELLSDVSFVALDVSTFFSPNTAWLRLCNVIGRLLVLSSDYIKHDQVSPDDWVFHVSMLAISFQMFMRSARPLILAALSISALAVRDRRAYALLFEAVGLTILQYKTLLSTNTLDWVEYEENEMVELDGEFMYFLYSGEATIPASSNKTFNNPSVGSSINESGVIATEPLHVSNRIFGDVQFAKALEVSLHKKRAKKQSKSVKGSATQATNSAYASRGSFVVGPNGAAMLRISTSKLLQLMKNDNELSSSIQRLILLCMQEKLSRSLQEGGLKSSSKKNCTTSYPSSTPNVTHPVSTQS